MNQPKRLGDMMPKFEPPKKSRKTERGELLKYFAQKINKPIGYVAFRLAKFSVQDMYFIKSDCDQAQTKGIAWGAAFYSSIKDKSFVV